MGRQTPAQKTLRAASSPGRPGMKCTAEPGTFTIHVDRTRCEGKADCVDVCPYKVFAVGRLPDAEFKALGMLGKLKSLVHGRKTAFTPRMDACRACGLCVAACPEKALTLLPAS